MRRDIETAAGIRGDGAPVIAEEWEGSTTQRGSPKKRKEEGEKEDLPFANRLTRTG